MKVEFILSAVLVCSTVVYTAFSLMLWLESRSTRKQKINPHIVAFLKSAENHVMLELHFKNIGEGLAKNVRVKVLHDYKLMGTNDSISDIGLVKNGFNVFPPQYELKYYIHSIIELSKEDKDGLIKLEISYESSDNRKFSNIYDLSFNQIFGQNYSDPPETFIGQIPHYLKEINSTLKAIAKDR